MPNLPRLRRGARGTVTTRPPEQPETPNVETIEANGLRWINIERPRAIDRAWLEEHFDFHPLDYEDLFSRGAGYLLYRIVDNAVDASFPMLRKIGNKLEDLEEDIFEGRSQEIVRDLSNAKQEIINFRKIVRPMRAALRDLDRTRRYVSGELEVYFDDIVDASERIWDMLENDKEVVEALEATNESVLSHRLNDVLRFLTAFSVLFLPLTLIASIWGMNVGVPGEHSIRAFWIIIAVMVGILGGLIGLFRRRGWL